MREPVASVSFDVGIDAIADLEWRFATSRGSRLRHALVQVAIAVVVGAAVTGALLLLRASSRPMSAVGGGIGAAVGLAIERTVGAPGRARRALARRLRGELGPGPVRCTVALDADSVVVHAGQHQRLLPWATVDAFYADGGGCVIHAPPARVVVPERAFADRAARERFLATARALRGAATTGDLPVN